MLRTTTALALLCAVLISACGGAKKPPASASTGGSSGPSPKTLTNDAEAFSTCMRNHGVTSFQDPRVSVSGSQVSVTVHVTPAITESPAFKPAQRACAHLMPMRVGNGGPSPAEVHQHTVALLAFAGCMRKHGFPHFPDPNSAGQLTDAMLTQAGINLDQPAVEPTADSCTSVTHGVISKADVAHAIATGGASGRQQAAAG